ncbi:hypothetical protein AYX14_04329 [Cryptococcus neoformans]|nr:hypothetical protein AYX15_04916 [Cryptococcus neoformans var. grubii]OWZ70296.1 hypothetical protein AYX14_04329 [Cryptococcus neoformans var. grubii]
MNKEESWRREGIWERQCHAGPSRLRDEPEHAHYGGGDTASGSSNEDGSRRRLHGPTRTRRQIRQNQTLHLSTILPPLFLLPFLGATSAAPAVIPAQPTRPQLPSIPTVVSTVTTTLQPTRTFDKRIKYLTSVITPSVLPTEIHFVDETILPYLLTKHADGSWGKAEAGWFLYGRRIALPTDKATLSGDDEDYTEDAAESATNRTVSTDSYSAKSTNGSNSTVTTSNATSTVVPSFAVEKALPNGWGYSSNRTSIYKVPLIAVASVIMAVAIVVLIIIYALNRRKKHRKQKRAKERLRRKALAAAGLTEDDIKGSAAEAAFKEKLAELERKHKAKKKRDGQMGLARSKVKGWNARLGTIRRRKGKKEKEDETMSVEENKILEEDIVEGETVEQPEVMVSPHLVSPPSPAPTQTPPEQSASVETSAPVSDTSFPISPTPYFPPAYRPASVSSIPTSSAGPSRPSASVHPSYVSSESPAQSSMAGEKTQAPGYYPAPATEDGEIALAVASRSDGKNRLVEPPAVSQEEDPHLRMNHIATDDKRVLERLRMGGSAPPPVQAEAEEGPTAPVVDVDDAGFEIIPIIPEEDEAARTSRESEREGLAFPPPPQLSARLAQFHNLDNPAPSAPPITSPFAPDHQYTVPSAPPLEVPDVEPSAPPLAPDAEINGPSAPSLGSDVESESEPGAESFHSSPRSHAATDAFTMDHPNPDGIVSEERRGSIAPSIASGRSGSVQGVQGVFLPRYEP